MALAFDGAGNLWIANRGIHNGPPTAIVGYSAATLAQTNPAPSVVITSSYFNQLWGLSFDALGNLWVADPQGNGVYEFAAKNLSSGGSIAPDLIVKSSRFSFPRDVALDQANNLWVAYGEGNQPSGTGPGAVQMFAASDLTGSGTIQPSAVVTLGGQAPCSRLAVCSTGALAFDRSGDLWISSENELFEFTPGQLASGGDPLAHVILVSNFFQPRVRRGNFDGPFFITFGPEIR